MTATFTGAAILPACSTDHREPDPCEGFSYAGHGDCVVLGGQAMCVCDEATHWDGFTCAPKPDCVDTGQKCHDDVDCCTGFCFWDTHLSQRYCSPHTCQDEGDCVDQSDEPQAMCCVHDSDVSAHCHKFPEGQVCGERTVGCGGFCDGQGDSACQPGHMCIFDGCHGYCAKRCAPEVGYQQCDDCRYGSELPGESSFFCEPIGEDLYVCLDNSERYSRCGSGRQCCSEKLQTCVPMTSADGMSIEGVCQHSGERQTGTGCDVDQDPNELPPADRCVGFYCFRDHCTEVCTTNADCPADMVCGNWAFQMDQAGTTYSLIGMCLWMTGSRDPCESDLDCPAGEVCDQYQPPNGPWTRVCTTPRCDPAEDGCADFGQPCGPGIARCASWLCLPDPVTGEGFCSAQCEPNQGCPPGADCVLVEVPGREDSMWACR